MRPVASAGSKPAGILLCLLAAALAAGCNEASAPGATATADSRVFLVEMARAGTRDLDVTLDAVGTAYASGLVDIRPQISGTLVEAPFVEGDRAEKGQVLARFDDSKVRASLELAQAQLDRARAKQ